jgi:hypothetical protein
VITFAAGPRVSRSAGYSAPKTKEIP